MSCILRFKSFCVRNCMKFQPFFSFRNKASYFKIQLVAQSFGWFHVKNIFKSIEFIGPLNQSLNICDPDLIKLLWKCKRSNTNVMSDRFHIQVLMG